MHLNFEQLLQINPEPTKVAVEPHCSQGNLTLRKHISRSGLKCFDETSITTFPRHWKQNENATALSDRRTFILELTQQYKNLKLENCFQNFKLKTT